VKKLSIVLCLMASAWIPALAQTNITQMEYFFDSDPGFGNGISIPITPGPVQDVDFIINTSAITVGFHTLVVRAMHQSGEWSVQDSRVVYVASESVGFDAQLADVEYFIDTDPGPGNGTPIAITSGSTSVDVFPTINTSALPPGFHVLHFRSKDADGNWGIPDARPFFIADGNVVTDGDIIQLEYFFDSEPGYGAGTPLTTTNGAQIDLSTLIGSASLSNGFHTISIRAKDNDGIWGFAETRSFFVDGYSQVTAIEYYIDTDPGEGSATSISLTPGTVLDLNFTIPTTAIAAGGHTIGIRAAGTGGTWSSVRSFSFSIQDIQTITFGALAAATYGDAPFNLAGSSSAGLPITYSSSDPLVATISGSTVTIVGAGTTTITASQAGDADHVAAADIQQTLIVNKADQAITFAALPSRTLGDPGFTLNATSTSALTISYSSSNPAVATIAGNTVTIVGAGTTNITASQAGNGNYNAATDVVQSLVVLPANNPPTITAEAPTGFFLMGPIVVNSTIAINDPDGQISSATVSISSGFQSGEDQLTFVPQAGIAGTYNTDTGVLALSGVAGVSDYQDVLRSVRYNNTSSSPNTGSRTISFQVNDGMTSSTFVTATITINQPPTIEAPSKDTQAGGNVAFSIDDIFFDPDNNLDLSTLTVASKQGALVTIEGGVITVNYVNLPDFKGTDEITMTICDQGGRCRSETVIVEIGADIDIYNGISANGDDVNAYFRIRFLPPQSRVSVFNRWGERVYDNSDYNSDDAGKRFNGVDNSGNELTAGTYYYKIALPDGRERFGYLQIKR
jgi:hypothetical protein